MKNIKYILFSILFLFFNIFNVYASCTDEEISLLEDLTNDIKITYKHLGAVETEDGIYYNSFEVKVRNLSDDMYISLGDGTTVYSPVNGEIVETFNNGTWNFDVYSNKCDVKIDTIKVFIPRFNMYSLDPLCNGIDGDDFALCGKYYEYDVDYDSFVARVNHYRAIHNVDVNDDNKNANEKKYDIKVILDNLLDYIIQYRLYIIISLIIMLFILIIVFSVKKRKKRGVLQ